MGLVYFNYFKVVASSMMFFFFGGFAVSAHAATANGASEHNTVRNALNSGTTATVGSFSYDYGQQPTPSPALADMSDDTAIANTAQTHAAKCVFGHSSLADRNGNGENIYASTGNSAGIADAVGSWAKEVTDYTYSSNSCAAGKACGHYTQVVWDDSTKVGCAIQQCNSIGDGNGGTIFGGSSGTVIVCQYNGPGNYSGQKPYDVTTSSKVNQTITFNDPADQTFVENGTFSAPASSDSGLIVTLTSNTPGVCTVSGTTVTMVSAGECQLAANQAGNDSYNAANEVTQTVAINDDDSAANVLTLKFNGQTIPNGSKDPINCGTSPVNTTITCQPVFENMTGKDIDITAVRIKDREDNGTASLLQRIQQFSWWNLLGISNAVAVRASDFSVNLTFPYTITSNTPVNFTINFTPSANAPSDGELEVEFDDGSIFRFAITGNGTSITPVSNAQNIPVFGPFGLLAMLLGLLWFGKRRRQ